MSARTTFAVLGILAASLMPVSNVMAEDAAVPELREWVLIETRLHEQGWESMPESSTKGFLRIDDTTYWWFKERLDYEKKPLEVGIETQFKLTWVPPDVLRESDADGMGNWFETRVVSDSYQRGRRLRGYMPGRTNVHVRGDFAVRADWAEVMIPGPVTDPADMWEEQSSLGYSFRLPNEKFEAQEGELWLELDRFRVITHIYTRDRERAADVLRMRTEEKKKLIAENEERYRAQDEREKAHDYYAPEEKMRRLKMTADPDFFCHDYAWRPDGRRTAKPSDQDSGYDGGHINPDKIMKDPGLFGFEEVTDRSHLQPADIVVYLNNPEDNGHADHSAVVHRLDDQGPLIRSKDVRNSIFEHRLGNEGEKNFFRDLYGAGGMRFFRRVTGD